MNKAKAIIHGVDAKTDLTFDFNLVITKLKAMGWQIRVFEYPYKAYEYTKNTRNGSWSILATKDGACNLDDQDADYLRKQIEESKLIGLDVIKESGDQASLIYQNHGDEEYQVFLEKTPSDVKAILEKCRAHYYIQNMNHAEGITEFAKYFTDCVAGLIGYAKCGDGYESYEAVESSGKCQDLALDKYAKLMKLKKKELVGIDSEKMLNNLIESNPDRVFSYDPECIENSGDYSAIFKIHLDQTGLAKKVTKISDSLDFEKSTAIVRFKANKSEYIWEFNQDSDWVSSDFYQNLVNLIEGFGKGTLLSIDTGDQTIKTVFIETAIAEYLCEEGVCTHLF